MLNSSTVELEVLGPLRVLVDGDEVSLGGGKVAALLAGLLTRANEVASVDWLTHLLWGGVRAPGNPRGTIQTYVRRLRNVLGDRAVRSAPAGYSIVVDTDHYDLARFRALVEEARTAESEGMPEVAAGRLEHAMALWRGDAFEGVDSDVLHRDEVPSLRDERLAAHEWWTDLLIRMGDHEKATPELLRLTREHPLRENLSESLMRALYRAGRRVDALAEHRRFSTLLREELGLDPGHAMRQLHGVILRGDIDPVTDVGTRSAAAPVPHQLPAETPGFTGRDAEMAELVAMLPDEIRGSTRPKLIVAIEGTAGVGKTALAIRFGRQAAARFPDGSIYLNLRGHGPGKPVDSANALSTLLRSVGLPGDQIPADPESRASLWRTHTAGRNMIVVLDNARSSEQLQPLLPGPGSLVVATSRTALSSLGANDGAHRLTLGRLPADDALSLLGNILGAHRVQQDLAASRQLVERCAYLPLAIRIMAERARSQGDLQLVEIVTELDAERECLDPFTLGDGVDTDLRAVFAHSFEALDPSAATLFRLAGLHFGDEFGADLAAAAVGCTPRAARALLDRLGAAHLVEQHRPGRFRFHDLLRAYAAHLASTADGADACAAATRRMLDWYLHTAVAAARTFNDDRRFDLIGPPPADVEPASFDSSRAALDWYETERGNLVAAIRRADELDSTRHAWQITWTLLPYFNFRPHMDDWFATQGIAVSAASRIDDPRAAGFTNLGLGLAYLKVQEHALAIDSLHRALTAFGRAGDRRWQGSVLANLAIAAHRAGRYGDSKEHGERALTLARDVTDRRLEGFALQAMSSTYLRLDRFGEALAAAEQAVAIQHKLGQLDLEALALRNLGMIYAERKQVRDAASAYRRAAELHGELGAPYDSAVTLVDLGDLCEAQHDTDGARGAWSRAHALFADLGHPAAATVAGKLGRLTSFSADALPPGSPGAAVPGRPMSVSPYRINQAALVRSPGP